MRSATVRLGLYDAYEASAVRLIGALTPAIRCR